MEEIGNKKKIATTSEEEEGKMKNNFEHAIPHRKGRDKIRKKRKKKLKKRGIGRKYVKSPRNLYGEPKSEIIQSVINNSQTR